MTVNRDDFVFLLKMDALTADIWYCTHGHHHRRAAVSAPHDMILTEHLTLLSHIRLSGTSRPADENKIHDQELEGARVSWDELTCVGFPVKDSAVKNCAEIS